MGGRRTLDHHPVAHRERRGNTSSARSRAANEPRNPKPRPPLPSPAEQRMMGAVAAAALLATAVLFGSMAFSMASRAHHAGRRHGRPLTPCLCDPSRLGPDAPVPFIRSAALQPILSATRPAGSSHDLAAALRDRYPVSPGHTYRPATAGEFRRATNDTVAPGRDNSFTSSFSSALQRRRRATPVITSTR